MGRYGNVFVCSCLAVHAICTDLVAAPDYSRDIRPLLAHHCYTCHGPDAGTRQADLRLDQLHTIRDSDANRSQIVVPGRPHRSRLFQRITSADLQKRMPPSEHGRPLAPAQIQMLKEWIEQGAQLETHWAFRMPVRPAIPPVLHRTWLRNPIDAFVLSRLEKNEWRPSAAADRNTLIRRLTLDLLGLPPTPGQVRDFLSDRQPGAWGRLVDRLLASPHYGERMAQDWLDAARHADTTGHAADMPRTTWLFRDWVIRAFNANMAFDQFTIEQLAGDMLPGATVSQRIATGFHRNSMQALGNNPRKEEFRIKGIVDRLDTTGRVWLGITLACAECHDHKYDPITTREYYGLFAVFNNVPHYGERFGVHGPRIKVLSDTDQRRLTSIASEIAGLQRQAGKVTQDGVQERFQKWLDDPLAITRRQQPIAHWPFTRDTRTTAGLLPRKPQSATQWSFQHPGPIGTLKSVEFTGGQALIYEDRQRFDVTGSLSIGFWLRTKADTADIVSKYDWKAGQRAFVFGLGAQREPDGKPGHLSAWISAQTQPFSGVTINGSMPVNDGRWHHVALSFTAGQAVDLYVDGQRDTRAKRTGRVPTKIARSRVPLAIGGGYDKSATPNAFFLNGHLADLRMFDRPLNGRQLGGLTRQERDILRRHESASNTELKKLQAAFGELEASNDSVASQLARLRQKRKQIQDRSATAQVMDEMTRARRTFVHIRGDFENPGAAVVPAIPGFLPAWDSATPVNRLTFARSLVDGANPLTARVTVNRIWQHYFGRGLVATLDDFGVRSEPPTHPQLLDWLAVELTESGWDLKHIQRLIVTSATYRQSSVMTADARLHDPQNLLLGRGARFRLAAEQIRDCALAASGQLYRKIGGASVYPQQPQGTGEFRDATAGTWQKSLGPSGQRRGLYTFWQRMSPYPSLILFDAPTRERSCVQRPITNTPLQALTTLNDPVYVEAAQHLGSRIHRMPGTDRQRIEYAFLLCLARLPQADERQAVLNFINTAQDPAAGWFRAAQVLLNLDEMLTRE